MRSGFPGFVLAALAATGCATVYVPSREGSLAPEPGLAPRGACSLLNAQDSKDEVRIGKNGDLEPVVTDLNAWTGVVLGYARGVVRADPGASKSLAFKVVAVKMSSGQYVSLVPVSRPSCEVHLEVTAGNGYLGRYRAEGKQLYSWNSACDDATRDVVALAFHDRELVRYLNE